MLKRLLSWLSKLLSADIEEERPKYHVPGEHFNPNRQRRRRREFMYRHGRRRNLWPR